MYIMFDKVSLRGQAVSYFIDLSQYTEIFPIALCMQMNFCSDTYKSLWIIDGIFHPMKKNTVRNDLTKLS